MDIRIKAITRGALTIAVVCVSFTLFKGATNIFNAFLVPLVLYTSLKGLKKREGTSILGGLILICLLFFKIQVIFTVFYCLVALLLLFIRGKKWPFYYGTPILTLVLTLSFWISIAATDALFLTQMEAFMLKAFQGNYLAYLGLLTFEGMLIAAGLLMAAKRLHKRLDRITE